jgi:hypothetical protein
VRAVAVFLFGILPLRQNPCFGIHMVFFEEFAGYRSGGLPEAVA